MDCSLPGSSVHGISQARRLEWVAIFFSRGSSWPRYWTPVSCIAGRFFTIWATREVQIYPHMPLYFLPPAPLCPTLSLCNPDLPSLENISRLNVYVPHKFISCNLTPSVMALGGGVFEGWLGHEGGALMNRISALKKEAAEVALTPSPRWGHGIQDQEAGSHQTQNLNLHLPRLQKGKK